MTRDSVKSAASRGLGSNRRNQTGRRRREILLGALGIAAGVGAFLLRSTAASAATDSPTIPSAQKPAAIVADALHVPLVVSTDTGTGTGMRIVAAGDHGVILLSDDGGKTFRQARSVPTQALLTSLSFIDTKQGWAAGNDGVILRTQDGGETWTLQHEDLEGDHALFAIRFRDAQHGLVVGLFGTAIATADGGISWTPVSIESGEDTDHHLYAIFGGDADTAPLLVAGESGAIYRSADAGASWTTLQTSNPGSFWAGAALADGSFIAAGQRGHIFLSHDQGLSWSEAASGTQQSLTSVAVGKDGSILITGLAGTILTSQDNGHSFKLQTRADRVPLNSALIGAGGKALLFGANGVTREESP